MPRPTLNTGDFVKLPAATPLHVVVIEASAGLWDNPWYGKVVDKASGRIDERKQTDQVKVVMKAVDPEYKGSRIWFGPKSFSVKDNAAYYPLVVAAAEKDPTTDDELLDAADTDLLVGKQFTVIGEYKRKQDGSISKYLSPKMFVRLPRDKWVEGAASDLHGKTLKSEAVQTDDSEDVSDF